MITGHKWKRDLLHRYRRMKKNNPSFESVIQELSTLHIIAESAIMRELEVQETAEAIGIKRLSNRQRAIDRMLLGKEEG